MGKLAIITLAQVSGDEKVSGEHLRTKIRETIEMSGLSKSWTIDAITILDEAGSFVTEQTPSV